MATPSRRLLYGTIAARLATVPKALGYYGQMGRPLLDGAAPSDPPAKSEDDPRVVPYYILEPGAGGDGPDTPVCGQGEDVTLDWRVRAAGGDIDDVLDMIDRLDAVLLGWVPTLSGVVCGPVRRYPGVRPPLLTDDTVRPPRLFMPLQYTVTATT